jgi:hypothetical protein
VKFLIFFLSIMVLALSTVPCCVIEKNPVAVIKTGTKNTQGKPQQGSDGCCDNCSPFVTCGSCAGFFVPKHIMVAFPTTAIETRIKAPLSYQQPFLKDVVLSIWLPPKIG